MQDNLIILRHRSKLNISTNWSITWYSQAHIFQCYASFKFMNGSRNKNLSLWIDPGCYKWKLKPQFYFVSIYSIKKYINLPLYTLTTFIFHPNPFKQGNIEYIFPLSALLYSLCCYAQTYWIAYHKCFSLAAKRH